MSAVSALGSEEKETGSFTFSSRAPETRRSVDSADAPLTLLFAASASNSWARRSAAVKVSSSSTAPAGRQLQAFSSSKTSRQPLLPLALLSCTSSRVRTARGDLPSQSPAQLLQSDQEPTAQGQGESLQFCVCRFSPRHSSPKALAARSTSRVRRVIPVLQLFVQASQSCQSPHWQLMRSSSCDPSPSSLPPFAAAAAAAVTAAFTSSASASEWQVQALSSSKLLSQSPELKGSRTRMERLLR
mmetsp:Transcript_1053/g.1849  ORF Transcript_1053/g.1849 Transcript_1053/m.1849 type:complete len:243 (+) Transcript_1053:302-1030(+)